MSFDGIFLHHLIQEIKPKIEKRKVHKLTFLSDFELVMSFSNKEKLLISVFGNQPHMRLTNEDYLSSQRKTPFHNTIRKLLEGSVLVELSQIETDRIAKLFFQTHDELGYLIQYYVFVEFFGRNANIILTDEKMMIIDAVRKTSLFDEQNRRTIVSKMPYPLPNDDRLPPTSWKPTATNNCYLGVSNELYSEMMYRVDSSFLLKECVPTLIQSNKIHFHAFNLTHIPGNRTTYPSLSELLFQYYQLSEQSIVQSSEERKLEQLIKRELQKLESKYRKQMDDLEHAKENLAYEKIGNLLSSNLHKIQKNQSRVLVEDYYNNNQEIIIELDSSKSPSQNMESFYHKFKKAKRTIIHIEEQLLQTKQDISYYETLDFQLRDLTSEERKEVLEELKITSTPVRKNNKRKPSITTYEIDNTATIYVGKNNIQNNYLTHEFANKQDYFFHVKNIPGSHTILRCDNPSNDHLYLTAMIAAYHSQAKQSSNVPVDYTKIQHVKKVPKSKGSFVTYSKQKTVYVTPDITYIEKHTIKI